MTTTNINFVEELHVVDKTTWAEGPWKDEPDKVVWVDEATGLDCMIVRHDEYGHFCGYVGVAEPHPAFGKDYDAIDVDVHGGLTFAAACAPEPLRPTGGICHTAQPGRPEHVYWLGFDCGHFMDYQPGMRAILRALGVDDFHRGLDLGPFTPTYKPLGYVIDEVERLAKQLACSEHSA